MFQSKKARYAGTHLVLIEFKKLNKKTSRKNIFFSVCLRPQK